MGLFDIFRSKPKTLEVPSAPPYVRELPELPSDLSEQELPPIKRHIPEVESYENKAIREEEREVHEREHPELQKPLFVDMDLFKAMMDEIVMGRKQLKEMDDSLTRMEDFRMDKDKEFDGWRKAIEDVQRKLIYADRTLFGR